MSGLLAALGLMFREVWLLFSYIKNNAFPSPLNAAEEKKALKNFRNGCEASREKLIKHNLRLVAHIVKKFENTNEDNDDLISIGTIGLIKAINSYQMNKGTKLATYAARCIENEILMHLRSTKKTKKDVSLHDPIGHDKEGNEITLIDVLKTEDSEVADEVALTLEKQKVIEHLDILNHREREVIIARYGIYGEKERTQREIAKKLGISRSYVSRIEKRALNKMFNEYYKKQLR
ncbi:RNA polymerase sporulation sigma factor SigK [Desulfuribacillus alkaliarsenatis]|uniref:RNA polymerase sigma factor n=1 Tax=Desulfuribacillus alkaliarsenatis TaxID=766136 RepID=A0A1E5G0N0_9FIRM|nr:RNA polymerase sporulation sigma factor SigK [Desulfuribacillus alkaliarsenatis]OEF96303.1 sporulation sigma factor SigK [Desulfuribacillus alkaliarsenatis]